MDTHFKSLLSNKKVYRIVTSLLFLIVAAFILLLAYHSLNLNGISTVQQLNDFSIKIYFLIYSLITVLVISALWVLLSVKQYSNSKWLSFYIIGALISVLRIRYILTNITLANEYRFNIYSSLLPFAIGGILSLVIIIIASIKSFQKAPAKHSLAT
jgi:hypothetical protein